MVSPVLCEVIMPPAVPPPVMSFAVKVTSSSTRSGSEGWPAFRDVMTSPPSAISDEDAEFVAAPQVMVAACATPTRTNESPIAKKLENIRIAVCARDERALPSDPIRP